MIFESENSWDLHRDIL